MKYMLNKPFRMLWMLVQTNKINKKSDDVIYCLGKNGYFHPCCIWFRRPITDAIMYTIKQIRNIWNNIVILVLNYVQFQQYVLQENYFMQKCSL